MIKTGKYDTIINSANSDYVINMMKAKCGGRKTKINGVSYFRGQEHFVSAPPPPTISARKQEYDNQPEIYQQFWEKAMDSYCSKQLEDEPLPSLCRQASIL